MDERAYHTPPHPPTSRQAWNSSFVSEQLERRESGAVWRVDFRGKPLYVCFLIEFHSTVERQLTVKFGRLPEDVRKRLDQAGERQLLRWGERFVTADSLEAVFAD